MTDNKLKGKHLSLSDRIYIEAALSENISMKDIALELGRHPSTIIKEIRRNRTQTGFRSPGKKVECANRKGCTQQNICGGLCTSRCSKCLTHNCIDICPNYVPKSCSRTTKTPYVCNGCNKNRGCLNIKYHYRAKVAEAAYRDTLSSVRSGINLTTEELEHIDNIVSRGINKGQPLAHILFSHRNEIPCSARTLYSYIDKQYLAVKNIDLRRKVKFKPRKKASAPVFKDQSYRLGRSYEDFLLHIETNPSAVVEMDTVCGVKGGKVLLTMFFRNCSMMLAFIMDSATQSSVTDILNNIEEKLGTKIFKQTFPLILTDNGSEFKNVDSIEKSINGGKRTKVFYCDPYQSGQKGRIEKNHEYIRYVVPKGKSFNNYTQEHITRLINHINSTARASLNEQIPYRLALILLNHKLLDSLNLEEIPADEVHLTPTLLKD